MRKETAEKFADPAATAPPARYTEIVSAQRRYFAGGTTLPLRFRLEQLRRLKGALLGSETALRQALYADLHKPEAETYLTEIFLVVNEINFALRHLGRWMKPARVTTDLVQQPARSFRLAEPLGVALVIAPWNYPVQLSLIPLVGAIAAGCCAIVKPSELAPATSAALARLVADTFPPDYVAVVEGGPEAAHGLLEQRFDHIFFTGGGRIARHILRAAAEHLTPVTLELGGKSPCVVDHTADLALAAKRVAYARFLNAGQTCVAPDFLLVQRSVKVRFLEALGAQLRAFWGEGAEPPEDLSRIVSDRHFERLAGLIEAAKGEGAQLAFGGSFRREERYIAPTVFTSVGPDSALMQEELFGPILPVLEYDTDEEALRTIASLPKPLAAYLFSRRRSAQREFVSQVSAGGICLNDCLSHMTTTGLPFGGVGASGMGAYHGKQGFATFSHYKSVMKKAGWFDLPLRYPPYSRRQGMLRLVRRLFS